MDAEGIFYFRIAATTIISLALPLNAIVVLLVIFKTPKEYRHFSIVYGTFCAVQAIWSTIGFVVIHENGAPINSTIPVVSYGLCANIGPYFCHIADQFTFPMIEYSLYLTPFSMLYRLYCFMHRPLKNGGVILCLAILAIPWVYCGYYRALWYVEPSAVAQYIPPQSKGHVYFGFDQPATFMWWFMDAQYFSPHFACVVTMIIRQILMYKITKASRTISNRSYTVHRQFAWMLTIQGLIPLISAIAATATFAVRYDHTAHPLLSTSSYVIFVCSPILDAIVIITCISPYRAVMVGALCSWKKKTKRLAPDSRSQAHQTTASIVG